MRPQARSSSASRNPGENLSRFSSPNPPFAKKAVQDVQDVHRVQTNPPTRAIPLPMKTNCRNHRSPGGRIYPAARTLCVEVGEPVCGSRVCTRRLAIGHCLSPIHERTAPHLSIPSRLCAWLAGRRSLPSRKSSFVNRKFKNAHFARLFRAKKPFRMFRMFTAFRQIPRPVLFLFP